MMRRVVALLLLLFVAIGDAEGVLTTACDVNEELAERVADAGSLATVPADERQDAPAPENCHCAHAHLQTVVSPPRVTRAAIPAVVAPISFAESAPSSADRALLLRPPRA